MIRNLIIDLCGPLLTIDTNKINAHFNRIGVAEDDIYRKLYYNGRVKEFDMGLISTDEFCQNVRLILNCTLDNITILAAWNDLIVDFDTRNVEALKTLHKHYRLLLLSNSDIENENTFRNYINRKSGFNLFEEIFTDVCFSNMTGMRKPDPGIFKYLVEKNRLDFAETLVIDDCRQHCESAKSTGMNAFLCQGPLWQNIDSIHKVL